jgi:hypothetical protein
MLAGRDTPQWKSPAGCVREPGCLTPPTRMDWHVPACTSCLCASGACRRVLPCFPLKGDTPWSCGLPRIFLSRPYDITRTTTLPRTTSTCHAARYSERLIRLHRQEKTRLLKEQLSSSIDGCECVPMPSLHSTPPLERSSGSSPYSSVEQQDVCTIHGTHVLYCSLLLAFVNTPIGVWNRSR